jgi:hypothetical protein
MIDYMYTLDGFQDTKDNVTVSSVKIGDLSISKVTSESNPTLRARSGPILDLNSVSESGNKQPKQKREPKEQKETRAQRLQRLRRERKKKKSKKSKKEDFEETSDNDGFEDYNNLDSNNYALFDDAFETFKNGKSKTKTKGKDDSNSEPKKIKRLDKAQKGAKHKKIDKSALAEYDEAFTNTNKPVYMLLPKAKNNSPIQILLPKHKH